MKSLAAALALACTGVALAGYTPPRSWIWLQPIAWLPAFLVISRLRGRRAFFAGWFVGATAIMCGYYWVAPTVERFSNIPAAAAWGVGGAFAAAHGVYLAFFAWGFDPVRRACGRFWPLGIAIWFTALEFTTPQLFPFHQGAMWYQQPWLFGITAVTGTSGITLLVILCNAVALQAVVAWRGGDPTSDSRALAVNAAVLLAALAFAIGVSVVRLARIDALTATAGSLRVALVQPNYDVPKRREMRALGPGVFARDLVAMSRSAWRADPDIDVFIWPEGALLSAPDAAQNREVLDFVRATGVEVWTGANVRLADFDGRRRPHNSAYRIHGDGDFDERYDKNWLVPFGEYMPLADVFPVLRGIRGPGDFARGQVLPVYDAGPVRFAFLICYEAIHASYVRRAVLQAPDLLVNLTFDGWYGDTSEPHTHLMLAAVQAAQYGLPLLRSTTTGISAVVDARGIIVARTGVFTREVLVADVPLVRLPGFYERAGDWLPWACVVASLGFLLWARRVPRVD